MGLIAKEGFVRPPRDPVPAGMQHAVCYAVIDLGTQPPMAAAKYQKRKRRVQIMWELVDERRDFTRQDGTTVNERAVLSKEYTLSLHENADLRPALEGWRGRPFTPDELAGFDLGKLLGVNCMLNVIHKKLQDGRIVERISGIGPLPKKPGFEKATPDNPIIEFVVTDHPRGEPLPERIPGWLKERIERSDEWQARLHGDPGPDDVPPPDDDDSDIPF